MDTEHHGKYCDKSIRDDPQGKNPHEWEPTIGQKGIELLVKKLLAKDTIYPVTPADVMIDPPNAVYRSIVEVIDRVGNDSIGDIIELTVIAAVNVKYHDDTDEKLSLYELILKRIEAISQKL